MKSLIVSTFVFFNPYYGEQTYFEKNISPIFANNCSSCHAALPGQDWTDYGTAMKSKSAINFRVFVLRDMPPVGTSKMTSKEKVLLKAWVTK